MAESDQQEKSMRLIRLNPYSVPADKFALQKTFEYGRTGAYFGLLAAATDLSISYTHQSVLMSLGRIGSLSATGAAVGVTYGSVLSSVGALRGKDDEFNHFVAGFFSAAIIGARHKSRPVSCALYLGVIVGLLSANIKGFYMTPQRKPETFVPMIDRAMFPSRKGEIEDDPKIAPYLNKL